METRVPRQFQMAGVHCGVKSDPARRDLSLVVSEIPAVAAGVYTQNRVFAAPVALNRRRTPSDRIRVVAINSGNANACTGQRGLEDAQRMAEVAADACQVQADQALVLSTGVIGTLLPMERIEEGIRSAAGRLGCDEASLVSAAEGMMTTDKWHKLAGRTLRLGGREIQITGMAKGAGMISPHMATMLGVILSDAALLPGTAQDALASAVDESFNCISVDGHMSTNDSVLLLANGAAGGEPLEGEDLARFGQALGEVCVELARQIPADGEGASHLITIEVAGCAARSDALKIARAVANSPLVKTAVAGADPNWGRIVSAVGYADVPFDPQALSLRVNGFPLYRRGAALDFDPQTVSDSIRSNRDTLLELQLGEGQAQVRFWASDLTAQYVRLNADYHT